MIIIGEDDRNTRKADIGEKIRELCEALLQDDNITAMRGEVDRFFENGEATAKFTALEQLGSSLHKKQHEGEEITDAEMQHYEKLRETAVADPAVQKFLGARAALQDIDQMISAWVSRTLELGRLPSERELMGQSGGSCGTGCGCH